jgi:hypothetical protein
LAHQRPLGTRQIASLGHRRCNSIHIVIAEGANSKTSWLICATGFSGWTRSADYRASACCSFPSLWSHRRGFGSSLRVEGDLAIPRISSFLPKGWDGLRASLWSTLRTHNCGVCGPTVGIRGKSIVLGLGAEWGRRDRDEGRGRVNAAILWSARYCRTTLASSTRRGRDHDSGCGLVR